MSEQTNGKTPIGNRYDLVDYFEMTHGSYGDPDAGNLPRIDPRPARSSPMLLNAKVRNFVGVDRREQPPYEIYVKEKAILESTARAGLRRPEET